MFTAAELCPTATLLRRCCALPLIWWLRAASMVGPARLTKGLLHTLSTTLIELVNLFVSSLALNSSAQGSCFGRCRAMVSALSQVMTGPISAR